MWQSLQHVVVHRQSKLQKTVDLCQSVKFVECIKVVGAEHDVVDDCRVVLPLCVESERLMALNLEKERVDILCSGDRIMCPHNVICPECYDCRVGPGLGISLKLSIIPECDQRGAEKKKEVSLALSKTLKEC